VGAASLVVLVSLFLPWFGFGTLGANISVAGTPALVAGPTLTGPHVRLRRPMAGQRGRGQAGEPTAFPGQVGLIGIACFGREGGQVKDGRAGVDA
jgi:hypothetical protein